MVQKESMPRKYSPSSLHSLLRQQKLIPLLPRELSQLTVSNYRSERAPSSRCSFSRIELSMGMPAGILSLSPLSVTGALGGVRDFFPVPGSLHSHSFNPPSFSLLEHFPTLFLCASSGNQTPIPAYYALSRLAPQRLALPIGRDGRTPNLTTYFLSNSASVRDDRTDPRKELVAGRSSRVVTRQRRPAPTQPHPCTASALRPSLCDDKRKILFLV